MILLGYIKEMEAPALTTGLGRNILYPPVPSAPKTWYSRGLNILARGKHAATVALAAAALHRAPQPRLEAMQLAQKTQLGFNITHDPEVLENPFFNQFTSLRYNAIPELQKIIYEKKSPLWTSRQRNASANLQRKIRIPDFEFGEQPTLRDNSILFDLQQIILIQAYHELYDPLYRRNQPFVEPPKTSESLIQRVQKMRQAIEDEVEKDYQKLIEIAKYSEADDPVQRMISRTIPRTIYNSLLFQEFDLLIGMLRANPGIMENDRLINYSRYIPVGAHIMYAFSPMPDFANAFHHGIYIGYKTVIEILNYNNKNGNFKTYQTVTHINDFLKRAYESRSPIIIRVYANPFPPEEIVKRAIWTLGEFPGYNLFDENCETVASWIASNEWGQTHYCITPETIFSRLRATRFNGRGGRRGRKGKRNTRRS